MAKQCSIDGCSLPVKARCLCNKHYIRKTRYGRTERIRNKHGDGSITSEGYRVIQTNNIRDYEHRLHFKFPDGAEIHHIDGDPLNNELGNLIICPSREAHMHIHRRERALAACGIGHYRKCDRCQEYDNPENMYCYDSNSKNGKRYRHKTRNGICRNMSETI